MSTGQRNTVESHSERTARLWESLRYWLERAEERGTIIPPTPEQWDGLHFWLKQSLDAVEVTAVDEAIEYTLKAYEIALTLRKHLRGV